LSTDVIIGEQFRDGETKSRRQFFDIPQRDIASAAFNVPDVRAMNARSVCKFLLS